MKKVMIIIGMFFSQEKLEKKVKNTNQETGQVKNNKKIPVNISDDNNIIAIDTTKFHKKKNNKTINNNYIYRFKMNKIYLLYGIIFVFFVYCYKFFKKEYEINDFVEEESLPCFKKQIQVIPTDLIEEYDNMQQKNFFLFPGDSVYFLIEKKEIEKFYKKTNIILLDFFFRYQKSQKILKNLFNFGEKTEIAGAELIPINYTKIIDTVKEYCFFSNNSIIFFSRKSFQKILFSNLYDEKKNKDSDIRRFKKSKEEFLMITKFFDDKISAKLDSIDQTPNVNDFTTIVQQIVKVLPKKEQLKNIKTTYIFCVKEGIIDISLFLAYKNKTENKECNLGIFLNNFFKIIEQKLNIKLDIKITTKKIIKVKEENFFEIPKKTINFLKKETKELILFSELRCYNIFENKPIEQIIKPEELEEKKKKLIREQDKKITEYFSKNPVPETMEIEALTKIMKKCLLSIDVLKDYSFF